MTKQKILLAAGQQRWTNFITKWAKTLDGFWMKYTGLCPEARADRAFEMSAEESPNFGMGLQLSFCIIPGTSGFSQLEPIPQTEKKLFFNFLLVK